MCHPSEVWWSHADIDQQLAVVWRRVVQITVIEKHDLNGMREGAGSAAPGVACLFSYRLKLQLPISCSASVWLTGHVHTKVD